MDADERLGLLLAGVDPDDPTVTAAIDLVRWELSMLRQPADSDIEGTGG